MIYRFYIPFILLMGTLYFFKGKKIFVNEIFWLICWWGLVFGTSILSNIYWGYDISSSTLIYIIAIFILFLVGRYFGKNFNQIRITKREDYHPTKYNFITILGFLGTVMFVFDYLHLNGMSTVKSGYNISIIGSLGSLFMPILLVMGLYRFGYYYYYYKKVDLKSFIYLLAYILPSILNSGRESIFNILIGIFVIKSFCDDQTVKKRKKITIKRIVITVTILFFVIITLMKVYSLTMTRFTNNEVNVFLFRNKVPNSIINEANKLGDLKYIYYTILSYFGHQLAFLSCMFYEYSGPYMYGMFELNILSRRLPKFLGLDYTLVSNTVKYLANGRFKGDWFTIIGSLIVDFGKIGALVAIIIIGFFVGIMRKRFKISPNIENLSMISLICLSMMSTVQLGPFYSINIYGAYIWWFLIFNTKIGKIKINYTKE